MNILWKFFGRAILKNRKYELPKDYSIKSLKGKRKYKIYNVDIKPYLRNFLKPGNKIKFSDYAIYLTYGDYIGSGGYGDFKNVYHDTQYSFVLTKPKSIKCLKETALACVGFDCIFNDSIIIKQIQGVSGKQNDLSCFWWTKMLLKICVDWARGNGFRTVYVIRAQDSGWYHSEKKRHENMFMRYDVTARRSGFKFDKKEKMYFLPLL